MKGSIMVLAARAPMLGGPPDRPGQRQDPEKGSIMVPAAALPWY